MISENELIEKFTHSSGKGGQNVNKVATCVYLKHIPTGLEVKCQIHRTQAANRITARKLLEEKVIEYENNHINKLKKKIEKMKRANRKRPKVVKEKILKDKKHRSDIKSYRQKIKV